MNDSLDDLAAFLMHRTSEATCTPDGRLRIFALVGAYREGRDVEAYLRQEASAFAVHPDYRPAWNPADGMATARAPDGPGAATSPSPSGGHDDVSSVQSATAIHPGRGDGDRGRTCPMCGSMPLPGGHCKCSYTGFDARNRPLRQPTT
jgi:hypothetical protein